MKRTIVAVLLLLAVRLSTGCSGGRAGEPDKATSQQPSSPPESAPALQAAAQTTAPVAEPPITVMVEKTYYNGGGCCIPVTYWAEVRISKEDAARLHDPIGTPKSKAWHLVPELADGRLRFALTCYTVRKQDCFSLNPGETFTIKLADQDDFSAHGIPAHPHSDKRFVIVNGVGLYDVADYSGEVAAGG